MGNKRGNAFAFLSDQLVTDSSQLLFNDSIFNYQYPPLSVQPLFSAAFFSSLEAAVQD